MYLRAVVLAWLAILLAGCGEPRYDFRLVEPALGIDREIARELVAVFAENSRHHIELVPLTEYHDTPLDALEAGQADLALASNSQQFRKGVATVMPLYPTVLHILSRRERDADDLRALFAGARVDAGPPGSASRQLMENALESLGLSDADVTFTRFADAGDAGELPDVVILYFPIVPAFVDAALEQMDASDLYRLLSFGEPEDIGAGSAIDRVVLLNPRLSAFVIPQGTYGRMQQEPVVSLAVDKLLVARPDVDDASIYDLISEIRRLQPALADRQPLLFRHLNDEFGPSDSTFVLHPGANSFVQRDAPDIYERYSGVAEVLVTLVIGAISGTYAMVQIYNRRRKNRIDVFYNKVIAVRDSIDETSSSAERNAAIERVRELQNKAFAMLVDEKLAADDSFRIFVTLSNDIIADLR